MILPLECAVIPAAGFGTRMLPATKSMPKEMMPILDKPAIQYVAEEAFDSGLNDIILVTGRHKRSVEDHFDDVPELEHLLREKGRSEALALLRTVPEGASVTYVRQARPLGLGHAILQARNHVRDRPFAVLLGDDLIFGEDPVVAQLRRVYEETGCSVLAVQEVPDEDVGKYGIVEVQKTNGHERLTRIVEKPSPDETSSRLASIGRYVFTPRIFEHLAKLEPGAGGELQLTDAVQSLIAQEEVLCLRFSGVRHDVGTIEGWLRANLVQARAQGYAI